MIYLLMGLTMLTGTLLSFHTRELMLFYGAYYGVCLFALRSIGYGKDFYESFSHERKILPQQKVLVAGSELQSRVEEDNQEDRFLGIYASEKIIKRRVLTWLLFAAGIWFFHFKQGVEVSFTSIIPLISCVLIVNAFYIGHFLLPLLLNILLVIGTYSPQIQIIWYGLYVILIIFSLYVIGTRNEQNFSKEWRKLLILSSAVFFLTTGLYQAIPEWKNSRNENQVSREDVRAMRQQLRKMKLDLGKMKISLPEGGLEELSESILQLERSLLEENLSQEKLIGLKSKWSGLVGDFEDYRQEYNRKLNHPAEGALNEKEMNVLNQLKNRNDGMSVEELLNELGKIQYDIQKTEELLTQNDIGIEEREKLHARLEQLKDQEIGLKDPDSLTLSEKRTLRSFLERQSTGNHKEVSELLNKENLLPLEREQLIKGIKNLHQRSLEKPEEILPVTIREDEMFPDKKELTLKDHLRRLLPFIMLAFAFFVVRYLLRKRDIKKIEGTDQAVLEELKDELEKLRSMKLSPREEVIYFYNLFHHSLQRIHYPERETPPSCIVREDMKDFHPVLEKPTQVITEVFAQCFYGQKDVPPKHLKEFRKSIAKVIKVYQLT